MQFCSFFLIGLFAGCVAADATQATESATLGGQGHHRPPPKEAVDACAGSSIDSACAFTIDGHDVTGTCRGAPHGGDGPLACAPDHPPPPPPAAFTACESSSAGATCAFDIDGHHVDGACRLSPEGTPPLACAPAFPPP
jgi:hypothetical protein